MRIAGLCGSGSKPFRLQSMSEIELTSTNKRYIVTIEVPVTISVPGVITKSVADEDGYPDEEVEDADVNIPGLLHDKLSTLIGIPFTIYDYEKEV